MNVDLEDVIDKWKSIFEAQFPDKLSAVDARKSNPLSPRAPQSYIFGELNNIPLMPSIIISGYGTQPVTDEQGYRVQLYQCVVEGYYMAMDADTVSRVIRRYGAAIDDTIRANNSVQGFWNNIQDAQSKYTGILQAANQNGLFQSVQVTFTARVVTD